MTIKERLQQVVAEMTEDEAAAAFALVTGATPVDVYGTAWGRVLEGLDSDALAVSGRPTIEIPAGIPHVG